jgi:hypothetical protein
MESSSTTILKFLEKQEDLDLRRKELQDPLNFRGMETPSNLEISGLWRNKAPFSGIRFSYSLSLRKRSKSLLFKGYLKPQNQI